MHPVKRYMVCTVYGNMIWYAQKVRYTTIPSCNDTFFLRQVRFYIRCPLYRVVQQDLHRKLKYSVWCVKRGILKIWDVTIQLLHWSESGSGISFFKGWKFGISLLKIKGHSTSGLLLNDSISWVKSSWTTLYFVPGTRTRIWTSSGEMPAVRVSPRRAGSGPRSSARPLGCWIAAVDAAAAAAAARMTSQSQGLELVDFNSNFSCVEKIHLARRSTLLSKLHVWEVVSAPPLAWSARNLAHFFWLQDWITAFRMM